VDYREPESMVIYRGKMHVSMKRNFQLMAGAAWSPVRPPRDSPSRTDWPARALDSIACDPLPPIA
jgi:hypothetical protein